MITDNSIVATDKGRSVTGTGIPAGAYVGTVTDTPVTATQPNPAGTVDTGSFVLVNSSDQPIPVTGAVSKIALGAETTAEDLFSVGTKSPGLDGQGHLGYAAQPGLAPFGTDVFTNPRGWLPAPATPVGRVVTASPAHPWLAIEGDTVRVLLARGHAMATAVGPAVPEEGQFPVPATSPCTFTITFADVSGTVPLSPAAFTILDRLGKLHHPQVTVQSGRPVPAEVTAGAPLALTVKAVLPTGGGQLRWTPQGASPVVSWDFDVEID